MLISGRVSQRTKEGSHFIQALCNMLEVAAKKQETLNTMLCNVNKVVCNIKPSNTYGTDETYGQTAIFLSFLGQDVLFP
jgi:hypothetical protein